MGDLGSAVMTQSNVPSSDAARGAEQAQKARFAIDAAAGAAATGAAAPAAGAAAKAPVQNANVKVDGTNGSTVPGRAALTNPAPTDARFLAGTTGPAVAKGKATTIKLADGKPIGGGQGRQQNAGDKKQNNYSVTDANYNPQLGIPAAITVNGNTHTPSYDETINLYSAAGYVQAYAPAEYDKMVAAQNAGGATVLEAAAAAVGIIDPATVKGYDAIGVNKASIPANVPGSGIEAKAYIASGTDVTGQVWARPHHALAQWGAYKQLTELGVPGAQAHALAGDDGVSGGGRLNGVNNQDGNDSLNAGEQEIFSAAAVLDKQMAAAGQAAPGAVVQALMHSHAMTDLDPGALTNPNINKLLNQATGSTLATTGAAAREVTTDKALAIIAAVDKGAAGLNTKKAAANGTKADNNKLLGTATGAAADAAKAAVNVKGAAGAKAAAAPAAAGAAAPAAAHDHGAAGGAAAAAPAAAAAAPAPKAAVDSSARDQALAALLKSLADLSEALKASAGGTSIASAVAAQPAAPKPTAPAPTAAPAAAAPKAAPAAAAPQVAPVAAPAAAATAAS